MSNGLLYLGALLVVIFSALFAIPNFIDWNGYRGVFEEEASKVLGREVRVGGAVNLKLLPVPYVRFEKVRIANISGQTGEPFVRADSFTMWLSGPALLRGVLEATEVEISKPVLTLVLDGKGGGNWTNVKLKAGELPFVPRSVTLRSVKIIDGAVAVYDAKSERIAMVDGVNGELSAESLQGPFRFKGLATWSGIAHNVAIATDTPSPDGSFALKAAVRAEEASSAYLLDGRVADFGVKPTFTGDWSGTIILPNIRQSANGKSEPPTFDVKAHVTADALQAKFEDVRLTLDDAAEPQTLTGSATTEWTGHSRFDLALSSKWLDLDRLAGGGSAEIGNLKALAVILMQSLSGEGEATAKINIEQVKIAGETAGGLNIDAERHGRITHLNKLMVSLPGGSRLDLTGELENHAGELAFSGNVFVGGTSLGRLRSWAAKSGLPIDIAADGPFSISGKIELNQERFALKDASGKIGGQTLSGDLTINNKEPGRIDATLRAASLDTRKIFPDTAAALRSELRTALGLQKDGGDAEVANAMPGHMRVRVIAGTLQDGGATYHDVDLTLYLDGDEVRLPSARLTTAHGLRVEIDGSVKTGKGGPAGTIAYDLVGSTPEAVADLTRLIGLDGLAGEERFKGVKKTRLAGLVRLGGSDSSSAHVTFDGLLNGAHFSGSGEFDGGFDDWRSRPSRIEATLDLPSQQALLDVIGRSAHATADEPAAPVKASIIAVGTIATGAKARIDVASQSLSMTFDGQTTWPEGSNLAASGALKLDASDYADALAVAGLALPDGAAGVEAHGVIDVARGEEGWKLTANNLTLGTSTVSGAVAVSSVSPDVQKITGKVSTDRVTVAGLLSALADEPAAVPVADDTASAAMLETRSIWPEGLFDFDALRGIEADLAVNFKSLELSGNLTTRNGMMQLTLTPGKLSIRDFTADAAGGKLSGTLELAKQSNGVALTTALNLDQAKLASLSPTAKGTGTFRFDANAVAQSPAGLLAVLTGTGSVALQEAEIPGPSAAAASGVVDSVLQGDVRNDAANISGALAAALNGSTLKLGNRELALKITNGSVKFDTVALDTPDGKVEATATADLAALRFNAACQLTAAAKPLPPPPIPLPNWSPPPPKPTLPPAIVLYDAPLDNLSGVTVNVDAANLQRELTVRQMERNVQALELSRRVDEERARAERERRKADDDQNASDQNATGQDNSEHLPPVIPESAGTANSGTAGPNPNADVPSAASRPPVVAPFAPAQQMPSVTPNSGQLGEPQPAQATNHISTQKITIEPIPAIQGAPSGAADAVSEGDPAAGITAAPKFQATVRPAPQPRRRPPPRRTSSDEVLKSLGAFR